MSFEDNPFGKQRLLADRKIPEGMFRLAKVQSAAQTLVDLAHTSIPFGTLTRGHPYRSEDGNPIVSTKDEDHKLGRRFPDWFAKADTWTPEKRSMLVDELRKHFAEEGAFFVGPGCDSAEKGRSVLGVRTPTPVSHQSFRISLGYRYGTIKSGNVLRY